MTIMLGENHPRRSKFLLLLKLSSVWSDDRQKLASVLLRGNNQCEYSNEFQVISNTDLVEK